MMNKQCWPRLEVGLVFGAVVSSLIGNFVMCSIEAIAILVLWYFVPNPFAKASMPTASTSPSIINQPRSTASPLSAKDARIFADVDAGYLVGLYQKYNSAQADEAVKTYIGKWIRISGKVADVAREKHFQAPDTARMAISVERADGKMLYFVVANFEDPRWIDRALIFGRRETVTVVGTIDHVIEADIILNNCKIVE